MRVSVGGKGKPKSSTAGYTWLQGGIFEETVIEEVDEEGPLGEADQLEQGRLVGKMPSMTPSPTPRAGLGGVPVSRGSPSLGPGLGGYAGRLPVR